MQNEGLCNGFIESLKEVKSVYLKQHILQGLQPAEINDVLRAFDIRIFTDAQKRISVLEEKSKVNIFLSRGFLMAVAGDIGDACYTMIPLKQYLLHPSLVAAAIFTEGNDNEQNIIGSMLILENSIQGEKAWILRATNPSQNFLERHNTEEFLKGTIRYIYSLAKKAGVKYIVAPIEHGGALSNRPSIGSAYRALIKGKEKHVVLDRREEFNGYNIDRACYILVTVEPASLTASGAIGEDLAFKEENSVKIIPQLFFNKGGWTAKPEYLEWLLKVRGVVTAENSGEEPIKVYYYGMGGGGGEPIDIVSCLLATDFDELVSFDLAKRSATTKEKIVEDLAKVGLKETDISIEYAGDSDVIVRFTYFGKARLVKISYSKDATKEYPDELRDGYHVLYSRGWPAGFRTEMSGKFKKELTGHLIPGKGFIVLENSTLAPESIEGFDRLDLGDSSWAEKIRRLDVFYKSRGGQAEPDSLTTDLGAQVTNFDLKNFNDFRKFLNQWGNKLFPITDNATEIDIVEAFLGFLNRQGLLTTEAQNDNVIIKIKEEVFTHNDKHIRILAAAIRRYVTRGVKAINYQDQDGNWKIVGFESELSDLKVLDHEVREVMLRKNYTISWQLAHFLVENNLDQQMIAFILRSIRHGGALYDTQAILYPLSSSLTLNYVLLEEYADLYPDLWQKAKALHEKSFKLIGDFTKLVSEPPREFTVSIEEAKVIEWEDRFNACKRLLEEVNKELDALNNLIPVRVTDTELMLQLIKKLNMAKAYIRDATSIFQDRESLANLRVDRKVVSVRKLIEEVVRPYLKTANKQDDINCFYLSVEYGDSIPETLLVNERMLKTAINNILFNAKQFNQENKAPIIKNITIKVEVSKEDKDRIIISITNDGPSFPSQLLLPGTREVNIGFGNTYGKARGTGFGLMEGRLYMQLHGGSLRGISPEGAGPTFFLTLPIDEAGIAKTNYTRIGADIENGRAEFSKIKDTAGGEVEGKYPAYLTPEQARELARSTNINSRVLQGGTEVSEDLVYRIAMENGGFILIELSAEEIKNIRHSEKAPPDRYERVKKAFEENRDRDLPPVLIRGLDDNGEVALIDGNTRTLTAVEFGRGLSAYLPVNQKEVILNALRKGISPNSSLAKLILQSLGIPQGAIISLSGLEELNAQAFSQAMEEKLSSWQDNYLVITGLSGFFERVNTHSSIVEEKLFEHIEDQAGVVFEEEDYYVAFKEALRNAVIWGNKGRADALVILKWGYENGKLWIDIMDEGLPWFDPTESIAPPSNIHPIYFSGKAGFSKPLRASLSPEEDQGLIEQYVSVDSVMVLPGGQKLFGRPILKETKPGLPQGKSIRLEFLVLSAVKPSGELKPLISKIINGERGYFRLVDNSAPSLLDRESRKLLEKWFVTNEDDWDVANGYVREKRGVYIGVGGSGASLSHMANGNFDMAVIFDQNSYITYVYIPLQLAVALLCTSRAEYLAFMSGVQFSPAELDSLKDAGLKEIYSAVKNKISGTNKAARQGLIKDGWQVIEGVFSKEIRNKAKQFWYAHAASGDPFKLSKMVEVMGNRGSWLDSEENFANIRKMAEEKKIVGFNGSLRDKRDTQKIADYLRAQGLTVGVLYTSNIINWIKAEYQFSTRDEIKAIGLFNDALRALPQRQDVVHIYSDLAPGSTNRLVTHIVVGANVAIPEKNDFGNIDGSTNLPSMPQRSSAKGGIDFRTLPIVTESIIHLKSTIGNVPLASFRNLNLSREISDIERMLNSDITPSSERIKEYIQASCVKGAKREDLEKVLVCIADILRKQEEDCCSTDPILKDILVVLEVTSTPQELKEIFLPT
jgi:signal transduction histidine kinase